MMGCAVVFNGVLEHRLDHGCKRFLGVGKDRSIDGQLWKWIVGPYQLRNAIW